MLALILALALLHPPMHLSAALAPATPAPGAPFVVVLTVTNPADVTQAVRLHADTLAGVDTVMAVIVPPRSSAVLTFTETLPTAPGTYTLCYGAGASVASVAIGVGHRVFVPGVYRNV